MSHYDGCREGYCGCGQSLSVTHTCRVTEAKKLSTKIREKRTKKATKNLYSKDIARAIRFLGVNF